jgi:hypothetical protein
MGDGADPALAGRTVPISSRPAGILLVGDVGRAFVDADGVRRYSCAVAARLLDAMDMAARGDFAVVGVVMDGTAGHLYAALKALRQGTRARIVCRPDARGRSRRLVEAGQRRLPMSTCLSDFPDAAVRLCGRALPLPDGQARPLAGAVAQVDPPVGAEAAP